MKKRELRVKIVKCGANHFWYKKCIGEVFTVTDHSMGSYEVVKPTAHEAYNDNPVSEHIIDIDDCVVYKGISAGELEARNKKPALAKMLANEIKANDVNREHIRELEAELAGNVNSVKDLRISGNLRLKTIADLKMQIKDLKAENKKAVTDVEDRERLIMMQQTDLMRKNDAIIENWLESNKVVSK